MRITDQTLMEQLRITSREIIRRKEFIGFTEEDIQNLSALRPLIAENIDAIVEDFYQKIVDFDEIARVIGDAESLHRLKNHQRNYILSLFDGQYDEDYIHTRLRIGLVHKRIGVSPKYYVSAIHNLSSTLRKYIAQSTKKDCGSCLTSFESVEKIVLFDLTLVFDTYINSLMDESRRNREELESYSESLEGIIAERTKLLKQQARIDGLTNLLNQQAFYKELKRELSRGQRQGHSTALIYFDLDHFKKLNDTEGHKRGDEILAVVAESARKVVRDIDLLARYGGDEFCIILPEGTAAEAEHLCARIGETIKAATEGSGLSCSMGIALSTPEKTLDANSLVKKADAAMYEAKKEPGFTVKIAN